MSLLGSHTVRAQRARAAKRHQSPTPAEIQMVCSSQMSSSIHRERSEPASTITASEASPAPIRSKLLDAYNNPDAHRHRLCALNLDFGSPGVFGSDPELTKCTFANCEREQTSSNRRGSNTAKLVRQRHDTASVLNAGLYND